MLRFTSFSSGLGLVYLLVPLGGFSSTLALGDQAVQEVPAGLQYRLHGPSPGANVQERLARALAWALGSA